MKRGKLTEDAAADLVGRITFTTDLADVKDCGLVVEAVVEQLPVKQEIFRDAGRHRRAPTRSWPPTPRRSRSPRSRPPPRHPGRVIGLHFFNPAPVQNLVEIIRTVVTDPQVLEDTAALARTLGKTPVVVGDKAGFIANALLFGYLNHAAAMFESKQASREDLDAAMRFGCGYPMGPLALLDLIGLDTAYEILDTMYKQSRDRLHAPAPILKQMIDRRHAGPEGGPRLLHLRGAPTARSSSTTRSPPAPTTSRSCATTSAPSASSAPAPWPPASSRCSPRPATP